MEDFNKKIVNLKNINIERPNLLIERFRPLLLTDREVIDSTISSTDFLLRLCS